MSRAQAITPRISSAGSPPAGLSLLPRLARKFLFLLVLLILLVAPILVIPRVSTSAPSIHGKELAARVLLALIGALLPFTWRSLDRRPLRLGESAVLAFMGAQLLSALLSGHFFYSLAETWHLWMLPGLALLLVRLRLSLGEMRAAVLTIAAAAAATAAYGFAAYIGLNPLKSLYNFDLGTEGRNYMHSFLGNPEYFGSYLAPVAVLCVSMAVRRGGQLRSVVLWSVAALGFLLAIALSGTRGAFLAFGLSAAVIAWKQGRMLGPVGRRRALGAFAGAVLAALAGLVILSTPNALNRRNLQLAQRFVQLFDIGSESVRERIFFYSLAGRMVAENPVFGSGPGSYKLLYFPTLEKMVLEDPHAGVTMLATQLRNRIAEHAHNDYLEVWAETGTLGFGALMLVLVSAAWTFAGSGRRFASVTAGLPPGRALEQSVEVEALRTGFFAAALCLFANAAFSFPLHLPARASLAWSLLGLFLAADEWLAERAQAEPQREREAEA